VEARGKLVCSFPRTFFFYEAACQVIDAARKSDSVFEHTSSERAPPLQPAEGRVRERVGVRQVRRVVASAHPVETSARWLNLLYALNRGRPLSPAHNTMRLEEGASVGRL
jgi:hypothetical protein